MFDFLKKKVVAPDDVLVAPIKGMAVPSSSINDPTFGQEMLGKGMAIEPSEGKLYSPIDGSVAVVIDTLNKQGNIDDDGYVNNLDQLKKPLETIDETKKKKVLDMKQKADKILNKVVEEIPKEYGKKQTIDYFLKWMDDNLTMDNEMMESSDSVSNMTEAFEKNYFEGCTSCVVNGKAIATGYSKVLARLCNKAGISAHIVLGNWKYSGSYTLVKVDFAGKQVYIDASGYKKDDLWNQRYISETLMARNLSVTDLFSEENGTK